MTTNKYLKLKEKQQEEVNVFPMAFAFSNKQFEEAMKELGLEVTDTDKIYKLGSTGGIYRRTDAKQLHEMLNRHDKEMKEAIAADTTGEGFIFEMFDYELANHEYCITWDVKPTLDAVGLTEDDINSNPLLFKGLNKACKSQTQHR